MGETEKKKASGHGAKEKHGDPIAVSSMESPCHERACGQAPAVQPTAKSRSLNKISAADADHLSEDSISPDDLAPLDVLRIQFISHSSSSFVTLPRATAKNVRERQRFLLSHRKIVPNHFCTILRLNIVRTGRVIYVGWLGEVTKETMRENLVQVSGTVHDIVGDGADRSLKYCYNYERSSQDIAGCGPERGLMGIAPLAAESLGLIEGDSVLCSLETPLRRHFANQLTLQPLRREDWEVVELQASFIEEHLLEQVAVVNVGYPLPLWLKGFAPVLLSTNAKNVGGPVDEGGCEVSAECKEGTATRNVPFYVLRIDAELHIEPVPDLRHRKFLATKWQSSSSIRNEAAAKTGSRGVEEASGGRRDKRRSNNEDTTRDQIGRNRGGREQSEEWKRDETRDPAPQPKTNSELSTSQMTFKSWKCMKDRVTSDQRWGTRCLDQNSVVADPSNDPARKGSSIKKRPSQSRDGSISKPPCLTAKGERSDSPAIEPTSAFIPQSLRAIYDRSAEPVLSTQRDDSKISSKRMGKNSPPSSSSTSSAPAFIRWAIHEDHGHPMSCMRFRIVPPPPHLSLSTPGQSSNFQCTESPSALSSSTSNNPRNLTFPPICWMSHNDLLTLQSSGWSPTRLLMPPSTPSLASSSIPPAHSHETLSSHPHPSHPAHDERKRTSENSRINDVGVVMIWLFDQHTDCPGSFPSMCDGAGSYRSSGAGGFILARCYASDVILSGCIAIPRAYRRIYEWWSGSFILAGEPVSQAITLPPLHLSAIIPSDMTISLQLESPSLMGEKNSLNDATASMASPAASKSLKVPFEKYLSSPAGRRCLERALGDKMGDGTGEVGDKSVVGDQQSQDHGIFLWDGAVVPLTLRIPYSEVLRFFCDLTQPNNRRRSRSSPTSTIAQSQHYPKQQSPVSVISSQLSSTASSPEPATFTPPAPISPSKCLTDKWKLLEDGLSDLYASSSEDDENAESRNSIFFSENGTENNSTPLMDCPSSPVPPNFLLSPCSCLFEASSALSTAISAPLAPSNFNPIVVPPNTGSSLPFSESSAALSSNIDVPNPPNPSFDISEVQGRVQQAPLIDSILSNFQSNRPSPSTTAAEDEFSRLSSAITRLEQLVADHNELAEEKAREIWREGCSIKWQTVPSHCIRGSTSSEEVNRQDDGDAACSYHEGRKALKFLLHRFIMEKKSASSQDGVCCGERNKDHVLTMEIFCIVNLDSAPGCSMPSFSRPTLAATEQNDKLEHLTSLPSLPITIRSMLYMAMHGDERKRKQNHSCQKKCLSSSSPIPRYFLLPSTFQKRLALGQLVVTSNIFSVLPHWWHLVDCRRNVGPPRDKISQSPDICLSFRLQNSSGSIVKSDQRPENHVPMSTLPSSPLFLSSASISSPSTPASFKPKMESRVCVTLTRPAKDILRHRCDPWQLRDSQWHWLSSLLNITDEEIRTLDKEKGLGVHLMCRDLIDFVVREDSCVKVIGESASVESLNFACLTASFERGIDNVSDSSIDGCDSLKSGSESTIDVERSLSRDKTLQDAKNSSTTIAAVMSQSTNSPSNLTNFSSLPLFHPPYIEGDNVDGTAGPSIAVVHGQSSPLLLEGRFDFFGSTPSALLYNVLDQMGLAPGRRMATSSDYSVLSKGMPILLTGDGGSGRSTLCDAVALRAVEEEGVFGQWQNIKILLAEEVSRCGMLTDESIKFSFLQRLFNLMAISLIQFSPSLLILDDLDKLCYSPEADPQAAVALGPADERSRHLCSYIADVFLPLSSSQGLVSSRVALLATSLSKTTLHPALQRHFLFENTISIPSPDFRQVADVLVAELQRQGRCQGVTVDSSLFKSQNLTAITKRAEGLSLKALQSIVCRAISLAITAVEHNKDTGKDRQVYPRKRVERKKHGSHSDRHHTHGGTVLQLEHLRNAISQLNPLDINHSKNAERIAVPWEEIGGLNDAKEILLDTLSLPYEFDRLFGRVKARFSLGILLIGPPGCGKTIISNAAAAQFDMRCIRIKGPELYSKYIGASEAAISQAFIEAKKAAPSIVFVDELEALAPKRGGDSTGVTDRVVNQMLCYLDGAEQRGSVYAIAATSRPDLVDAALLRPGRFDKICYCGVPSSIEKLEILRRLISQYDTHHDVDLARLVDNHIPVIFTPADLQSLITTAYLTSIHEELNERLHIRERCQEPRSAILSHPPRSTISLRTGTSRNSRPLIFNRHLMSAAENTRPTLSVEKYKWYLKIYHPYLDHPRMAKALDLLRHAVEIPTRTPQSTPALLSPENFSCSSSRSKIRQCAPSLPSTSCHHASLRSSQDRELECGCLTVVLRPEDYTEESLLTRDERNGGQRNSNEFEESKNSAETGPESRAEQSLRGFEAGSQVKCANEADIKTKDNAEHDDGECVTRKMEGGLLGEEVEEEAGGTMKDAEVHSLTRGKVSVEYLSDDIVTDGKANQAIEALNDCQWGRFGRVALADATDQKVQIASDAKAGNSEEVRGRNKGGEAHSKQCKRDLGRIDGGEKWLRGHDTADDLEEWETELFSSDNAVDGVPRQLGGEDLGGVSDGGAEQTGNMGRKGRRGEKMVASRVALM